MYGAGTVHISVKKILLLPVTDLQEKRLHLVNNTTETRKLCQISAFARVLKTEIIENFLVFLGIMIPILFYPAVNSRKIGSGLNYLDNNGLNIRFRYRAFRKIGKQSFYGCNLIAAPNLSIKEIRNFKVTNK